MKPKSLMILGSISAATGMLPIILGHTSSASAMVIFAGAAVFGKGYGVWEERCRNAMQEGR